jgi:molecular chaperone HscC
VALWDGEAAQLVPNALGQMLTPSAVSVLPDGTTVVGQAALERMAAKDGATQVSFKRYMGTDHKLKLGRNTYAPKSFRPWCWLRCAMTWRRRPGKCRPRR